MIILSYLKNHLKTNYKADRSGLIGSVIMFAFALLAIYRWQSTGLLFFVLLFIRDLSASYFLITRKRCTELIRNKKLNAIVAYISSACPLVYLSSTQNNLFADSLFFMNHFVVISTISSILAIAGFTISTFALFELGTSFGVSPANRGIIKSGIYKYLKHPMYSGYVIAEFGLVLLNPINILIFIISVSLYFCRCKIENKTLCYNHKTCIENENLSARPNH